MTMKTGFYYVYILRAEGSPPHFYTGFTENLEGRLEQHNAGGDPYTATYRPWRLRAYPEAPLPPLGAARLPAPSGADAAFAHGLRRAKSGSAP